MTAEFGAWRKRKRNMGEFRAEKIALPLGMEKDEFDLGWAYCSTFWTDPGNAGGKIIFQGPIYEDHQPDRHRYAGGAQVWANLWHENKVREVGGIQTQRFGGDTWGLLVFEEKESGVNFPFVPTTVTINEVTDGLSVTPFMMDKWREKVGQNPGACKATEQLCGVESLPWMAGPDTVYQAIMNSGCKPEIIVGSRLQEKVKKLINKFNVPSTEEARRNIYDDRNKQKRLGQAMRKVVVETHMSRSAYRARVLEPVKRAFGEDEEWWSYVVNAPFGYQVTVCGADNRQLVGVTQQFVTKADILGSTDAHGFAEVWGDFLTNPATDLFHGLNNPVTLGGMQGQVTWQDKNSGADRALLRSRLSDEEVEKALIGKPGRLYATYSTSGLRWKLIERTAVRVTTAIRYETHPFYKDSDGFPWIVVGDKVLALDTDGTRGTRDLGRPLLGVGEYLAIRQAMGVSGEKLRGEVSSEGNIPDDVVAVELCFRLLSAVSDW